MKRIAVRFGTVLFYILVLLFLMDFKLSALIDLKSLFLVALGTLLLTAGGYKRGMDLGRMTALLRANAMITAILTSAILLFMKLYENIPLDTLFYQCALCCRPLLYGMAAEAVLRGSGESDESRESGREREADPLARADAVRAKTVADPRGQEEIWARACLTEREREVARLLFDNCSNREIGERLYISEATVKKHTNNLYRKLNIHNREQLKNLTGSPPDER